MSSCIGPNGFHDGEFPDYDSSEDDGEALSKLCDNPAYLVVGSDDDLVNNLPAWVEDLLTEHEELGAQAEKIGLEPSFYVSLPDRGDNAELCEFLGELGFTTDSSYIERGPLSSIDGVVYVRKSKIPALEKRAARQLDRARRKVIRDGRRALKPGRAKYTKVLEELAHLVSVAQLADPAYRERLDRLEELERESAELHECLHDRDTEVAHWKGKAEDASDRLAGETQRILHWVDVARGQSDRYAAWTWAVYAEFGIEIRGPLLKLADGRAFAISNIYGEGLDQRFPGQSAAIEAREPGVDWLSIGTHVRRGLFNGGSLSWDEVVARSERRLTWNQVWWVVLGFRKLSLWGTQFRHGSRGESSAILPADYLGSDPARQKRWDELLDAHWGTGIDFRPWRQP